MENNQMPVAQNSQPSIAATNQSQAKEQGTQDLIESGAIERIAITLKKGGAIEGIVLLATRGQENIDASKISDKEYLRIAKELVENREATVNNNDGKPLSLKIKDIDENLLVLKNSTLDVDKARYTDSIGKLNENGANSFDEAIPTKKRLTAMADAVDKSKAEETGLFKMIINFIISIFSPKTMDELAKDDIANSTNKKLTALGENQEIIKEITATIKGVGEKKATLAETSVAKEGNPLPANEPTQPVQQQNINVSVPTSEKTEAKPESKSTPVASANNTRNLVGIIVDKVIDKGDSKTDPDGTKRAAAVNKTTEILTETLKNPENTDLLKNNNLKVLSANLSDAVMKDQTLIKNLRTTAREKLGIFGMFKNDPEIDVIVKENLNQKINTQITRQSEEIKVAMKKDEVEKIALNESPMDVAMKAARQEREVLGGLGVNNRDATMLAMTSKPREANTALG
jgi:hypothetical protein